MTRATTGPLLPVVAIGRSVIARSSNPVEKIEMVARTVASQLREGVPGLSAALGKNYYVHAYVSLSGRCQLRRQDVDSTTRVVATDQLAQALRGLDQLPSNRSVPIAEYRDAIVEYVTAGRDGTEPGEADSMIAVDPGPSPGVPSQAEVPQVEEAKPRRRHRKLLWLPVAALVALTIACAWMYWSSRPVSWDAAADRLGKTATVYGPVVQSTKKPRWAGFSYINVGRDFRPGSPTPFYLRIDPEYRAAVEAELRQRAAGSSSPWDAFGTRTIWVKGRLLKDDYDGVFMLVKSANDIHLGEPAPQSGFLIAGLVCATGSGRLVFGAAGRCTSAVYREIFGDWLRTGRLRTSSQAGVALISRRRLRARP